MVYHSSGMVWVPYMTTEPDRDQQLCSSRGTWSTSSSSFFINLGVCRAVRLFFLSHTTATQHSFILSLLCYHRWVISLEHGLFGPVLGPFRAGWNQLCPTRGSPRLPLTEAIPSAHCANKSLLCQPNAMSLTAKIMQYISLNLVWPSTGFLILQF